MWRYSFIPARQALHFHSGVYRTALATEESGGNGFQFSFRRGDFEEIFYLVFVIPQARFIVDGFLKAMLQELG